METVDQRTSKRTNQRTNGRTNERTATLTKAGRKDKEEGRIEENERKDDFAEKREKVRRKLFQLNSVRLAAWVDYTFLASR